MAVGLPFMILERSRVIHFTQMTYTIDYGYRTPYPRPLDPAFKIVSVFEPQVWLWSSLATVSETLLAFSCHKLYKDLGVDLLNVNMRFNDLFLLPTAIVTSQLNKLRRPALLTGGGILLKWVVTTTLLSTFYQSSLLASLVAVDYEQPIDTSEVKQFPSYDHVP